jgi:hypothetical protein
LAFNAKDIAKRGQLVSNRALFIITTIWHFPYSVIEFLLARYTQPQSFAPFSMANVALSMAPIGQNRNFNVKGNEHG